MTKYVRSESQNVVNLKHIKLLYVAIHNSRCNQYLLDIDREKWEIIDI